MPLHLGETNHADSTTGLTAAIESHALLVLNPDGVAVSGSGGRVGLEGSSDAGVGVAAFGVVGLRAGVVDGPRGRLASLAIEVLGRNAFTAAGVVRFKSGSTSSTVRGQNAPLGALVLATPQTADASFSVTARRLNDSAIRLFLNQPAPEGGLRVAYFVVEHASPAE